MGTNRGAGATEGGREAGARAAETVVGELGSRAGFDWVGVYWLEGGELVLGPCVGSLPAGHERIVVPEGVCGAVAATGKTEVVSDVRNRPGHIACDVATKSEVVVPILRGGEVVGVLDVDSNAVGFFSAELIRVVEEAATEVAADPAGHPTAKG